MFGFIVEKDISNFKVREVWVLGGYSFFFWDCFWCDDSYDREDLEVFCGFIKDFFKFKI